MLRHGETDWNTQHRLQGHTDIPLNETGRRQAKEMQGEIRHLRLDFCYTSDLCRASETAHIALDNHPDIGSGRIQILRDLRERRFGRMEEMTDQEVSADTEQNPHLYHDETGNGKLFPNDGEKMDDFRVRIQRILQIVQEGDNRKVLFVTHGGVIRQIWREIVNPDHNHQPRNSTLYTLTQDRPDGKWSCFPFP